MQTKARAGSVMYKGREIPEFCKIILNKQGRECYLSGVWLHEGTWFATVRYIDDYSFTTLPYNKLKPYL